MLSAEQRNSLAALVEKYHSQIAEGGTEAYLTERGISRRGVERFQLGYSGETGNRATANRLTIPYLTAVGPWQLKYRCIQPHNCKEHNHGKYIYDAGAEIHLYNARTLLKADRVVVVEGELDAISVEMAGVPAVAYPGVEMWRKHKFWRFCFDSAEEVIVVADGDAPREGKEFGVGEEAARAVADSLRTSLPDVDVRLVVMPVGEDSNSYIRKYGQLDYLEQIGWI